MLEALTRVPELADKYLGKIKCVYIDPPFNTAQTFAHYEDNLEHSVWLTMMRDRLIHLRELLSDDGSIWVHLDDVENHRMRVLMDEVFGADNFQAEIVWEKADSPRNNITGISSDHDVILVYSKSDSVALNRMPRTAADNVRFQNPDGDKTGVWFSDNRTAPHSVGPSGVQMPALFGIEHPLTGKVLYPARGRQWCFNQDRVLAALRQYAPYEPIAPDMEIREQCTGLRSEQLRGDVCDLRIPAQVHTRAQEQAYARIGAGNWPEFFVTDESFGRKSYPPEQGQPPRTWWSNGNVGHNREAKSEIKALFKGIIPFSTPKPERLLERIIHIATNPGDIVLDAFAGSGTTAAVAQKMGRRWVTCELVEDTFTRFTLPRLEKVIRGEDMGGISTTKGERVDATCDGLPEGMTPDEGQKLTSLLNKALRDHDELKKDPAIKTIKRLVKTKNFGDIINWRGGGGFTVAHLAPPCYTYDPKVGHTTLTAAATGDTLVASVAANLGFHLTKDDPHFDGRRGNEHLAVIEGVLTEKKVNDLMAHVPDKHSILFAATVIGDGVAEVIRSYKNGSRALHVPLDMFPYSL